MDINGINPVSDDPEVAEYSGISRDPDEQWKNTPLPKEDFGKFLQFYSGIIKPLKINRTDGEE